MKDEWAYVPNGALKFVNEVKLAQQKEVFSFILKKIGSNLLSGKSILDISLPVTVFDRR